MLLCIEFYFLIFFLTAKLSSKMWFSMFIFSQNQLIGSFEKVNLQHFANGSTSFTVYNSFNRKVITISNKHYVLQVILVPENNNHDNTLNDCWNSQWNPSSYSYTTHCW